MTTVRRYLVLLEIAYLLALDVLQEYAERWVPAACLQPEERP